MSHKKRLMTCTHPYDYRTFPCSHMIIIWELGNWLSLQPVAMSVAMWPQYTSFFFASFLSNTAKKIRLGEAVTTWLSSQHPNNFIKLVLFMGWLNLIVVIFNRNYIPNSGGKLKIICILSLIAVKLLKTLQLIGAVQLTLSNIRVWGCQIQPRIAEVPIETSDIDYILKLMSAAVWCH